MPRHTEINDHLARKICKDLGSRLRNVFLVSIRHRFETKFAPLPGRLRTDRLDAAG